MQDVTVPLTGQPASSPGAGASMPAAKSSTKGSACEGTFDSAPRSRDTWQTVESRDRENRENRENKESRDGRPRELLPKPIPAPRPKVTPGPTILTFPLSQRPRAKRASAPKVRTGCKNCKKRRIKCDEGKPECNRCIKANYKCEGYIATDFEDDAPEPHTIAPAPGSAVPTVPTAPAPEAGAVPAPDPRRQPAARAPRAPLTVAMYEPIITPPVFVTDRPVVPVMDASLDPANTAVNYNYSSDLVTSALAQPDHSTYTFVNPISGMPSEATSWPDRSMAPIPAAATYPPSTSPVASTAPMGSQALVPAGYYGYRNIRIHDAVPVQNQPSIYHNSFSQYGGIRVGGLQKRDRDDDDYSEASGDTLATDYSNLYFTSQSSLPLPNMPLPQPSPLVMEPDYNYAMFKCQEEKMYFDSWLNVAPNLGGGWFPSHLWTTTIPHLCEIDMAVKYAAIAVGAMAEAMSPALLGKSSYHLTDSSTSEGTSTSITFPGDAAAGANATKDPRLTADVERHYHKALTYFGFALKLVSVPSANTSASATSATSATSASTTTVNANGDTVVVNSSERERAAVMCCLLFVCFEALQGNRENALRHITAGLQIIDQFVVRNVPQRALAPRDGLVQSVESPPSSTATAIDIATSGSSASSDPAATPSLDPEAERQKQRQRMRDRQLGHSSTDAGAEDGTQNENDSNTADPESSGQKPLEGLTSMLTRSPAPYILEDEVMQVFRRLDFQAWSLGVFRLRRTRPADIKLQALDALNPASIPERFGSLDDARRWWDLVQHWVLQFPRYMVAALQKYMDQNPDAEEWARASGRMLDICDVPGASDIQKEYLECLERWQKAFWPLYQSTRDQADMNRKSSSRSSSRSPGTPGTAKSSKRDEAYLQAASLQVPYILAWIGVKSLVYSDYERMHELTPQFRELNRLAAIILPRQPRYSWSPFGGGPSVSNGSAGLHSFGGDLFTMDNGPTMALFIVSCKCRIEAVRNEAIRLLAAYPRRDGFWDSKILWAIANWNSVIEKDNQEGSPYAQWLRLRQREAIFDETKPQVQMTGWVKNKETGEFEFKRQIVTWDSR